MRVCIGSDLIFTHLVCKPSGTCNGSRIKVRLPLSFQANAKLIGRIFSKVKQRRRICLTRIVTVYSSLYVLLLLTLLRFTRTHCTQIQWDLHCAQRLFYLYNVGNNFRTSDIIPTTKKLLCGRYAIHVPCWSQKQIDREVKLFKLTFISPWHWKTLIFLKKVSAEYKQTKLWYDILRFISFDRDTQWLWFSKLDIVKMFLMHKMRFPTEAIQKL